jgi:hypothetical protein
MSPISSYLIGLQTNFEAQKTDLEDFQHKLRLQKLLSMPLGTSNTEFNIAEADLQEQEAQGRRWRLIRAGDLKAETISGNRQETQAEIFGLTEHQANAALGVPDGIWDKDANRASAQEHRATLIENTVWPIMSMMAQDITVQVVVPNYGPDLRARFEDIRPRNRELILKETESAREAQTYDEARQADGHEPHPDPDVGGAPFDSAGQAYIKSVSLRLLRKAKVPADYPFQSVALSPFKRYLYQEYLKNATSEVQIKALFSTKNGAFDAADIYIEALKGLIERAQAGEITREEFIDQADTIITTQLEAAFLLGAEADTVGEAEQAELDDEIEAALDALPRLADDVFARKFAQVDDTTPPALNLLARLALWGSAALGAYSLGSMVKGAAKLMIWLVGPTDHCKDCLRLDEQIHTGADWRASPWRTQGRNLECNGYNCLCIVIPAPAGAEAVGGF